MPTPAISGEPYLCELWVTEAELATCLGTTIDEDSIGGEEAEAVLTAACEAATWLLYVLTGRRWGGSCDKVLRRRHNPSSNVSWRDRYPSIGWPQSGGTSTGVACRADTIDLQTFRPFTITAVKRANVALTAGTDYLIAERRYLVAQPPIGYWPIEPFGVPNTHADAIQIEMTSGNVAPQTARQAAQAIAEEYLRLCTNNACSAPLRATTVTRAGTTVQLDVTNTLALGFTGISIVDEFIAAASPGAKGHPSYPIAVLSPEIQSDWYIV